MDLMLLIIFGLLTLLGAALSNLLSDEFKAWQPWIVRKIIALAVSWMPASERDRWHEEWTGYCLEIPGQFGQVIAALGFVLSAWRINGRPITYVIYKRTFDIVVAIVTLATLAPLFLITAVILRLTFRGPIFYRQKRLGRGGKEIGLIKFRTIDDSGQIGKVGNFLRKSTIDETPQLWNVFKGDMSLVGPRARRLRSPGENEIETDGRPGLVAPSDVGEDNSAQPSFWSELRVLLKSILHVLRGRQ